MAEYSAQIVWQRDSGEAFTDHRYSRGHQWFFDGGMTVPASSSSHIVPLPYSIEANVDPEEAFVASLSSCHMLFFLSVAAKRKCVIEHYEDNAVGKMEKNEDGKIAMTEVTLKPKVIFSGEHQPSRGVLETMHHESHEACFIANSVKTEVKIEIIL
jgi:organic hydroperoxide reductase OsmC/OhrA